MLSIGNAFQGLPSLCTNAYLSTSSSACSISALISPKSYKAAPNCISRADSSSACLRRVSPGVQHYIPKVSKKQYRGGSKEAEATLQRMARAGRTCRSRLGFELRLCFFRDSRRLEFTFFRAWHSILTSAFFQNIQERRSKDSGFNAKV